MRHKLKIWKFHFDNILFKGKRFEIRKEDDRVFDVGDILELHVWDTTALKFTGEMCEVDVVFIHRGLGLQSGFCVMGISKPREVSEGL